MADDRHATRGGGASASSVVVVVDITIQQSDSGKNDAPAPDVPEKKLTKFTERLAWLEKGTNSLGALGFIWATVVLLGGFAIKLVPIDFWMITTILVVEGARIFFRKLELEWQHQRTRSIKAKRSRLRCYCYWVFQLLPALTCVALSLFRLIKRNFGEIPEGDTDARNRKAALILFYSLALLEALLFLGEKAYWYFMIGYSELFKKVSEERGLNDSPSGPRNEPSLAIIRRFFFDALSKCINGSVYDSAKMDLVSFAEELLVSDSRDEQRIGVRILSTFVKSEEFVIDTIRKIGTSYTTMERLVEMLNWKHPSESPELRLHAAEVVAKLAGKKRNVLRVAGIRGSIESIASLLENTNNDLHLLGLSILKNLAHNHDNCHNIGNTRSLLQKIIQYTAVDEWLPNRPECYDVNVRVKAAVRSLKLLRMLVSAPGETGKVLRRDISDIVFTVKNMRDILQHGGQKKQLQKLAIEILACLALESDSKGRIGATGGVVYELFKVLFIASLERCDGANVQEQLDMFSAAGDALVILTLDSPENCRRMLGLQEIDCLTAALHQPILFVCSGRILTNLYRYGEYRGLHNATPKVLQMIMVTEKQPLEVALGLLIQIFQPMASLQEAHESFRNARITETDMVDKLIHILRSYIHPSVSEPNMRRYAVELTIWLLGHAGEQAADLVEHFKTKGLEELLQNVTATTSELERYNILSGTSGLNPHETTIESLVNTAMGLLQG